MSGKLHLAASNLGCILCVDTLVIPSVLDKRVQQLFFSYFTLQGICHMQSIKDFGENCFIPLSSPLLFVCVEVLWPSQPIRVMSSVVSLSNHTFSWAGLVLMFWKFSGILFDMILFVLRFYSPVNPMGSC